MSVDYGRSVVDWDAYVEFLNHIHKSKPNEELYWDLFDEFREKHILNHLVGTEFEDSSSNSTSLGLELSDLYKQFRMELEADQRTLCDTFFGSLMPEEFSGCGEEQKCHDVEPDIQDEQTIAALNPTSVNKLYEVWKSIDLERFTACVKTAADEGKIRLDSFLNVEGFVVYIRVWARLVECAANHSKGLTVSVAV